MDTYAYPHFRAKVLLQDRGFLGGPEPGEPFPAFDLPTLDGDRVTSEGGVGQRPLFLYFASIT